LGGLGDWLENWLATGGPAVLTRAFLSGLGWLGQRLLGGLGAAATGQGLDVVGQLPPDLTLDDPTVRGVWDAARGLFNGAVGAGLVATGFLVLLRVGGVNAREVGELLPRLGIGVVLVNGSLEWLRALVGLANATGAHLTRGAGGGFARLLAPDLPPAEAGGVLLVVAVMAGLLVVQRILMLAVLDLLAMTAPLALAAWVVPAWSSWFWRWANLLGALLVGSVLQTLLLTAGAGMLARAVQQTEGGDAMHLAAGGVAVGVLLLTAGAPALVGLGVVGGTVSALARHLARRQHLRPVPPQPGRTPGRPGDKDDTPETKIEEVERRPGTLRRGGDDSPTIIYTRLPSLPPSGGPPVRPALPPPDYLKD
jgi:hypothetical protein